jgi:hypothetical protein
MSAIHEIHKQIDAAIGPGDPSQFFTMLLPGQILDERMFLYDTSGAKPSLVAVQESRLVNQSFNVAQVTGGSNGRQVAEGARRRAPRDREQRTGRRDRVGPKDR